MFEWNGSEIFLGEYYIEEGSYEDNKYWKIVKNRGLPNEIEEYCIVRFCLNTFPCLIDELKPIFKLQKNGTRWTRYQGKKLILLKVVYKDDAIVKELTLDKINYKKSLELEVQKIFVFRELLGITQNFEKFIILREFGKFMQPISFYETNLVPFGDKKVIPDTVLNKWFTTTTLDDCVKKMFNIKNMEDIAQLSHNLRTEMEKVVERVDKETIGNIAPIINRIITRLQYILD